MTIVTLVKFGGDLSFQSLVFGISALEQTSVGFVQYIN